MFVVFCCQFLNHTAASAPLDSRREESGSHTEGGQDTEVGGQMCHLLGEEGYRGPAYTLVTVLGIAVCSAVFPSGT